MAEADDQSRRLVLALLTTALTLSYVDRYLVAVLVQPIKAELGLTDVQIGLLTGFAFAAFYALLGMPIARLADRGHRRLVIGCSVVAWSVMTALSGAVQNFAQMAIMRFGVGAGEAGVFPTSQAIIADTFPPERRTTAMAVFASGGSLGLLIAFTLGSLLETHLGWRWTFVALAMPGIVVAPMIFLGLPADAKASAAKSQNGIANGLASLWNNPDFRQIPFAQGAVVILIFGQAQWLPAFFERSFAASRTSVGMVLGPTQAVAGILGIVPGGVLADRLRRRDARWPLRVAQFSLLAAIVPAILLYGSHDLDSAYVMAAITCFLFSVPAGPIAAHLQSVVPPPQRASAAAAAVMIASFVGLGGGPVVIGGLSDLFAASAGADSLRYALLVTVIGAVAWASWHLARLQAISLETSQ